MDTIRLASETVLRTLDRAYRALSDLQSRPRLLVASYFDRLGEALPVLARVPVEGLAVDFTGRAAANLDGIAAIGGLRDKRLVAGCRGPHVDRQVSPAAGVSAAEHPRGSVCANWPLAFIDERENTQ